MRFADVLCSCAALLALTGCVGAFDPYQRPGNWAEEGAANETIAQQAANPADLIHGQSETGANGIAATGALDKALGANGAGTAAGLQTQETAVSVASSN